MSLLAIHPRTGLLSLPESEFATRLARTQQAVRAAGLDALLVHSNEADFANVRYLCDYWPLFESAGVIVPAEGEAMLLIGPESEAFAEDRSRLAKIRKLIAYRETAEPDYPGVPVRTFAQVFDEALDGKPLGKLGLAGTSILPLPVLDGLREAFPNTELVKADDLIIRQRIIKSEAEMEALRLASRISEDAIEKVLPLLTPGISELQAVGLFQKELYAGGAEYEAMPLYVLSGRNTRHAISRPTHKTMERGDDPIECGRARSRLLAVSRPPRLPRYHARCHAPAGGSGSRGPLSDHGVDEGRGHCQRRGEEILPVSGRARLRRQYPLRAVPWHGAHRSGAPVDGDDDPLSAGREHDLPGGYLPAGAGFRPALGERRARHGATV